MQARIRRVHVCRHELPSMQCASTGNAGIARPTRAMRFVRNTCARSLSISLIACPPSMRLKPPTPLFPEPRAGEPTAIRLPTKNRATVRVMAVNAFAEPRRRTFWKRQCGRLVAQEALVTQPLGSGTCPGLSDNADRVPRLLNGSRHLRLRHHFWKFPYHSLLRPRCIVPGETGSVRMAPRQQLARKRGACGRVSPRRRQAPGRLPSDVPNRQSTSAIAA